MTEPSPPPAPPGRSIRLVRPLDLGGVGVFAVSAAGKTSHYVLHEIPCAIGGRGFEVHKLGLGTLYHVRVGRPVECSCECMGFLARGVCRHVLGLLALIREGKL